MSVTGRVHQIDTFGTVDGPGVRYVVFLQGCPLKCVYCHNPDTWATKGGNEMHADEVIDDVKNYFNFIKNGGLTISGGEPLLQAEFSLALLNGAKKLGLHTAIDTSGTIPLAKCKDAIDAADLILLDVKTVDAAFYKELTGGRIEPVIELLNYCESIKKPVWARHVVIPGLTLSTERLEQVATFLSNYSCIKKIELLPFHKLGENKWEEVGIKYKLLETPPPTTAEMEQAEKIFNDKGLNVYAKKL